MIAGAPVILRARRVSVAYDALGKRLLDGIDLDLAAGEIVAVLGASGVGKSSLLRALAGLQPLAGGEIEMAGQPLEGVHPAVAVAFQDPALLPWLSLERNVAYGLNFRRQPAVDAAVRRARVDRAIEEVGLSTARHLRPAQLSGGMAQRAALARCLARQPRVLLLDEPFGALDEVTRAGMQQLLLKVVADFGTATLLITHDIDEALAVADRVLLLGGAPGRIAASWRIDAAHPREDGMGALRAEIYDRLHESIRLAAASPCHSRQQTA
ncbi:ABC transporter ATP-binding protein [Bordetella genomosp. 10]|uniref:ABC transporter ATP-binding protein n=1 Tax=Bordetella genomosp. 10 TaxID=1416804 RepID=A0A261SMF1_9BORD|nr:ABC transporter ATP-binding protein [Bordetella genomosp. 10]OZI37950.1 ABC transporter ATP-binding protein [Bordetella genomosp. 10]